MDRQVRLWGHVPRIVLAKKEEYTESYLTGLVKNTDLDLIIKSAAVITEETGKTETNHSLIHIIPNEDFDAVSRSFASTFVTDLVYNHFKETSSDRLIIFLSHLSDIKSVTGVLFGKLFERHCREVIAEGGSFEVRDLRTDKIRLVKIMPSKGLKEFTSPPQKIEQSDGNIYAPKSKIHTAIDFLIWTANALQLFNATTNTDHNVIMDSADGKSGVFRFLSSLPIGLNKKYLKEFYFAVPKERFKDMKLPKFLWNLKNLKRKKNNIIQPSEVEKQEFQESLNFYAISIPMSKRQSSSDNN
jgi:hypothetical protein